MRVMMRIPFVLLLLWVAGCASTRKPRPPAEDETEREQAPVERDGACEWRSTVTVHVDNQNSADVKIWFGYYTPARAAPGLSQTTYRVPRSYLSNDIQLRIERGGARVLGEVNDRVETIDVSQAPGVLGHGSFRIRHLPGSIPEGYGAAGGMPVHDGPLARAVGDTHETHRVVLELDRIVVRVGAH